MAYAVKRVEGRVRSERVPAGVTLTLNEDEARVLAVIVSKVGGLPSTRRRFAEHISDALRDVGYVFTDDPDWVDGKGFRNVVGGIIFE